MRKKNPYKVKGFSIIEVPIKKKSGIIQRRPFLVFTDKNNCYKVYAGNGHQAIQIVMSIGKNPPPSTEPPSPPKKPGSGMDKEQINMPVSDNKDRASVLIGQKKNNYGGRSTYCSRKGHSKKAKTAAKKRIH